MNKISAHFEFKLAFLYLFAALFDAMDIKIFLCKSITRKFFSYFFLVIEKKVVLLHPLSREKESLFSKKVLGLSIGVMVAHLTLDQPV